MYRPGELEIGNICKVNERGLMTREKIRGVFLPHSCDEWEIGGPDEIRALIHDLEAALVTLERASE